MGFLSKITSFVTGGLPTEIAKQVGEHLGRKTEKELKEFSGELAYDLQVLKNAAQDKLCTRQGIAWTFHLFMWANKIWTGEFPHDVIFTWSGNEITIGFIYVIIIFSYYPVRAIEKWKKAL